MRRQHPTLRLALLLPAVVLLLLAATPSIQAQDATATTAAAAPEANSTAALNTTAPAASNTATAASVPTGNATDNATTLTLSSVDQQLPPFKGLRSCLPFNILLAAAKENATAGNDTAASSNSSSSGRIIFQAEFAVINQTVAAIEDDVLTLSLAGGFESRQPINLTVVMPAAAQLRYVANYGSGAVVLGPGHNTTLLRLLAPTVGTIQAFNVTADTLAFSSNGVLGSSVSGAFKHADIVTDVATGSVALTSSTPVNLTVQLGGITTVVADVPAGSSISGSAGGLSKVQYTDGNCDVTTQMPFPFPAPSIFGPGGFGFGAGGNAMQQANSKCQQVQAGAAQPVVAIAANPQWTCGVIVDGTLSCQQGNDTGQVLQWNVTNTTATQQPPTTPDVAPPPGVGNRDNPNAVSSSPSPTTAAAAAAPPTDTTTGTTNAGTAGAANAASPSPSPAANVAVAGNAGNSAGNNADATAGGLTEVPALSSTTSPASPAAATTPSPEPVEAPLPAPPNPAAGTGGGRKMLQGTPVGFGLPSAFQGFPFGTTTMTPGGTISTGSFTSGPGASSFSSGSVPGATQMPMLMKKLHLRPWCIFFQLWQRSFTSGPGASSFSSGSVPGATQTSTSQGGSPATTTLSTGGVGSTVFNPVVVPATTPQTFAADNATSNTTTTTNATGASPSPQTTSPSAAGAAAGGGGATPGSASGGPVSVSMRTAGPSGAAGVAVVNTACSSRQQSLSMLVTPAAEQQRPTMNFPTRPGGNNGGTSGGTGSVTGGTAGDASASGAGGASNNTTAPASTPLP
uniref:Auto-transporter adhesin head GIN domain-containing protein n=1 Tax=Tetradesmus obliquus TaxID=3088 RepID=A0A383W198_TETOB|eukprot:jgi/Sobl393_1/8774/SZX71468.1